MHHQSEKIIHDCKAERETYASMLKSKFKIFVPKHLEYNDKAVDVFDPMRNVVVMQYSSVSTAAMALRCMCKNMGQVSISDTFIAPYVATILGKAAKGLNLISDIDGSLFKMYKKGA